MPRDDLQHPRELTDPCGRCAGTGRDPMIRHEAPEGEDCNVCSGTGRVPAPVQGESSDGPRVYCAVVQPLEGGHPVTMIATVHKDDFDALAEAVQAWLKFDNEVEPPKHDAPYGAHLAYEQAKLAITERVAAALQGDPVCPGCEGKGQTLYHGGGRFAEIRACSMCSDGRKLGDTLIPNVSEVPGGA